MSRTTHTIDASNLVIGRLATHVATLLQGKHKPGFKAHIDDGDFVSVVNAIKLKVTGRKALQKELKHHTWHPGGLKRVTLSSALEKSSADVLRRAVWNMLPKNNQRKKRMARLTITN